MVGISGSQCQLGMAPDHTKRVSRVRAAPKQLVMCYGEREAANSQQHSVHPALPDRPHCISLRLIAPQPPQQAAQQHRRDQPATGTNYNLSAYCNNALHYENYYVAASCLPIARQNLTSLNTVVALMLQTKLTFE